MAVPPDDRMPTTQSAIPCVLYAAKSSEDPTGSIRTQIEDCYQAITTAGGRVAIATEKDEAASAFHGTAAQVSRMQSRLPLRQPRLTARPSCGFSTPTGLPAATV
jgi:hypothetical protein